MKAIQADPTNKGAYYTLGFIDWATTYPDYAGARQAAGMKPQDSGIIPDAALRQKVRTQHGAQIEDGFRMLQIAIQLDPDYSDAMAYMNLLYRIEAGIADTPAQSADAVAKADNWVTKALDAKRRQARNPRPADGLLDVDGAAPGRPVFRRLRLRHHRCLRAPARPEWRRRARSASVANPSRRSS